MPLRHMEEWRYSSTILDLGTRWRWMDDVEKRKFLTLLGLEHRLLGHPVRSQSLYRLRYPGSSNSLIASKMLIFFSRVTEGRSHYKIILSDLLVAAKSYPFCVASFQWTELRTWYMSSEQSLSARMIPKQPEVSSFRAACCCTVV
jgi:hypothetical protein